MVSGIHRVASCALLVVLGRLGVLGCGEPSVGPEPPIEDPIVTDLRRQTTRNVATLLRTRTCLDCVFYEVDLAGVDLHSVNLEGSNFAAGRGADLAGTNFRGANLKNVKFAGRLERANFDDAVFDWRSRFVGARVEGATFRHATLRDAKLDGADWSGVDFRGADLEGATFYGFMGLINGIEGGARHPLSPPYGGSRIHGADFREAILRRVDFSRSELDGSDLRGADLLNTRLREPIEGLRLEGARDHLGRLCGPESIGRCVVARRPARAR